MEGEWILLLSDCCSACFVIPRTVAYARHAQVVGNAVVCRLHSDCHFDIIRNSVVSTVIK